MFFVAVDSSRRTAGDHGTTVPVPVRVWLAPRVNPLAADTSKVVPLEEGKFYGHLSGLVSLPGGLKPDSPEATRPPLRM